MEKICHSFESSEKLKKHMRCFFRHGSMYQVCNSNLLFHASIPMNADGTDPVDILNDPEIEAVLICSSTDTHSRFIIEAAKAKKNIFCEKPIDYDLNKVHEAINAAKEAGVKLQIGFCRRFDHNHRAVYDMVQQGKVGKVNLIKVSSRDPRAACRICVQIRK